LNPAHNTLKDAPDTETDQNIGTLNTSLNDESSWTFSFGAPISYISNEFAAVSPSVSNPMVSGLSRMKKLITLMTTAKQMAKTKYACLHPK
jgi:hypothetical protein